MKPKTQSHVPATGPDAAPDEGAAAVARSKAEAAYDAGLVRRFKAGDDSAFTEIIRRHFPRDSALANQNLRNPADAEEIAQDTFVRAYRALVNFRGDCSLASWLHRIGLNLARNRYWFGCRRHFHETISLDRPVGEEGKATIGAALSDGTGGPRSESMTAEFLALVAEGMKRLDAAHREILTMRVRDSLSYEEMASRLQVNVGTVKSRVARARECLREHLRDLAPELGRDARVTEFFEFDRPPPAPCFSSA